MESNLAVAKAFEPFVCPVCKIVITDEKMHGWVRNNPKENRAEIVPCPLCSEPAQARRRLEEIERLLGQAHLPVRAHSWSFATVPSTVDEQAIATCKRFSLRKGEDCGLFLYGDYGSGKTGLAIAIIQAAMQRGEDAVFIRSLDLLDRLRQAIRRGTDEGDDLLALVKSVTWLALDDLATERPTDFVIEKLQDVLETRRDNGLYTVITSNFSLRELESHWRPLDPETRKPMATGIKHAGRRVLERLAEYCELVQVKGRNQRQRVVESSIRPIERRQG